MSTLLVRRGAWFDRFTAIEAVSLVQWLREQAILIGANDTYSTQERLLECANIIAGAAGLAIVEQDG